MSRTIPVVPPRRSRIWSAIMGPPAGRAPRITSAPRPRFSVDDAKPSRKLRPDWTTRSSDGARWSRSGRRSSGLGTSARRVCVQSGFERPSVPAIGCPGRPSAPTTQTDVRPATECANAMRPPRGDQSGCESRPGPRVSFRMLASDRSSTQMSESPADSRMNATRRPPGDQAGAEARPGVSARRSGTPPVASTTHSWRRPARPLDQYRRLQKGELDRALGVGEHGRGCGRARGDERRELGLQPCPAAPATPPPPGTNEVASATTSTISNAES